MLIPANSRWVAILPFGPGSKDDRYSCLVHAGHAELLCGPTTGNLNREVVNAANPQAARLRSVMAVVKMPESPRNLAAVIEQRPGLLKAQDLIMLLGFEKTAIYEMVAAGRIPYLRFDSSIRFDPIAIAAWMREHTVKQAA